jgi:hypothetical protein
MSRSIDELLDIINSGSEKREKKDSSRPIKTVVQFVEDMGIEPGTQLVPNYLIFYYYRVLWKPSNDNSHKGKKITFFQSFNKLIPSHRNGKQRFYLIKKGIFDEAKLEDALHYDKNFWSPKKTKQKKLPVLKELGSTSET